MSIPFEYPVVHLDPEDPVDAEISYSQGLIEPIRMDHEPYEMILNAQGYRFHLIFGSQVNGHFLCIPNWQFSCELARLNNKSRNLDSILRNDGCIDYEDATAITWALDMASELIQ